jgi:hypothetical protein
VIDELTEDQKRHLDACVETVKKEMYSRLKLPIIGLAAVFAVAVSIFATYLYMQAKINVMNAQTEFAEVKKNFYEDAMAARKEIDAMVATYNGLAENAEASVKRMQGYEKTLETIATNYANMMSNKNMTAPSLAPPEMSPQSSSKDMPPPLVQESSRPPRDIFQIPQQRQPTLK